MHLRASALVTAVLLVSAPQTWSLSDDPRNNLRGERIGDGRADDAEFSRCPFASKYPGQLHKDKEFQELLGKLEGFLESPEAPDVRRKVLRHALNSKLTCKGNVTCDPTQQFRNVDGSCNNLAHPDWGRAGSCMQRELPPAYGDCPGPNPTCLQGPECIPIEVPENDDFYAQYNVTLLGMKRNQPCNQCRSGPRYQMNQQTSYIDLSQIYGYNDQVAKVVRKFRDGLLRSQEVDGAEYLPASLFPYIDNCSLPEENALCVESGDVRVNQQPGLMSMQTLWMREHNRVAHGLGLVNTHWDDERLFQVARRIVEGRYQHILFSEWLPWQLGQEVMDKYDLWPRETGRTSYDDRLDATLNNEFTAAHFRYAHANTVEGYWRIDGEFMNNTMIMLKDAYFLPISASYTPVDDVLRGSILQPLKPFDRFGDHAITHYLFRQRSKPYGLDLFAMDIQRGRDHGVRPYVDWVRLCQNITIADFDDLSKVMSDDTAKLYAGVYEDVRDIDLFSGGLSETRLEGAQLGATFACGIAKQFRVLKHGDRFYYENANQSGSFTEEQLDTLRNSTLASILCQNVVGLDGATFNRNAFLHLTDGSDGVTCGDLPDIDLSKWKEENAN